MAKDKKKDKDKKKKKKNKNNTFTAEYQPVDSVSDSSQISDNTLLYTVLGVSAGLVLALAFGTERGREIIDRVAAAVNNYIEQEEAGSGPVAKAVKTVKGEKNS